MGDDPKGRMYERKCEDAVGRGTPESSSHGVRLPSISGRRDKSNVVLVHRDQLLGRFVCDGRPSPLQRVVVYRIVPANHDISGLLVDRHAANTTTLVLNRPRWLTMALA